MPDGQAGERTGQSIDKTALLSNVAEHLTTQDDFMLAVR